MRAFTILGPSQSGKTTLAESLAALEGRPTASQIGNITLRTFSYLGEDWASLDIAGGGDHLPAAAQALAASDAAVLCVPPDPDAAPFAAPYLRLAEDSGVPVFLFVNRMDQAQSRIRDTVAALQSYAAHSIVLRQVPIREGGHVTGAVDLISERAWHYEEGRPSSLVQIPPICATASSEARTELLEHLADFDDALLEQLIEDKAPPTDSVYDAHREPPPAQRHHRRLPRRGRAHERREPPDEVAPPRGADARKRRAPASTSARGHRHRHRRRPEEARGQVRAPARLRRPARAGRAPRRRPLGALQAPNGAAPSPRPSPPAPSRWRSAPTISTAAAPTPRTRRSTSRLDPRRAARAAPRAHARDRQGRRPPLRRHLPPRRRRPGPRHWPGRGDRPRHRRLPGPDAPARHARPPPADFGVEAQAAPVPPTYRETIRGEVHRQHRHKKQTGGAGQFAEVHLTVRPSPAGRASASRTR
jgi:elongation factor G